MIKQILDFTNNEDLRCKGNQGQCRFVVCREDRLICFVLRGESVHFFYGPVLSSATTKVRNPMKAFKRSTPLPLLNTSMSLIYSATENDLWAHRLQSILSSNHRRGGHCRSLLHNMSSITLQRGG